MSTDHSETVKQTLMASPSLGALILAWLDAPLTIWQVRLGVAFLVLQGAYLLRKWWREERPKKRSKRRAADVETGPGDL